MGLTHPDLLSALHARKRGRFGWPVYSASRASFDDKAPGETRLDKLKYQVREGKRGEAGLVDIRLSFGGTVGRKREHANAQFSPLSETFRADQIAPRNSPADPDFEAEAKEGCREASDIPHLPSGAPIPWPLSPLNSVWQHISSSIDARLDLPIRVKIRYYLRTPLFSRRG